MQFYQFTPLTDKESLELNGGLHINLGDLIDITTGDLNLDLTQLANSVSATMIMAGRLAGATLTNAGDQLKNLLGSFGN